MPTIAELAEHVRMQGDSFDKERIHVNVSEKDEHKLWLSKTTVFLKHAERNWMIFFLRITLNNEKMLIGTCAAYVELINQPTPEITAYFAFWSVRNNSAHDMADEVQPLRQLLKLQNRRDMKCLENLFRTEKPTF